MKKTIVLLTLLTAAGAAWSQDYVSTLEIFVTVEPTSRNKKLDLKWNAGVIDPELTQ